jgi:hypothetical protein
MGRSELFKLTLALHIMVIIEFAHLPSAWGCSAALLAEMQQRNIPEDVIRRECGIPDNEPLPSSNVSALKCKTPKGACSLDSAARVGTPCWCNTIAGQIPGEVR